MGTGDEQDTLKWPQAFVAIAPGTADERTVAIHDVLVIGRESAGGEPSRQLIIDDDAVSRRHVEIRLDLAADRAYVFDTSTNGTRINGNRIDQATNVPINPGDRLTVGNTELEFRAERFVGAAQSPSQSRSTMVAVSLSHVAMTAGDIVGYPAISQYTDESVLLDSVDQLYRHLRALLNDFRGSLNNQAGDAFFAIWEFDHDAQAVEHALAFAVAASKAVHELAPTLPLRTPDDEPIRMGWGVEFGQAAISALSGRQLTVIGNATNLAVRLSGLAGRDGRAEVLATARVQVATEGLFRFGEPEEVLVKGRLGAERVFAVSSAD